MTSIELGTLRETLRWDEALDCGAMRLAQLDPPLYSGDHHYFVIGEAA
jgi:hypothetical protein